MCLLQLDEDAVGVARMQEDDGGAVRANLGFVLRLYVRSALRSVGRRQKRSSVTHTPRGTPRACGERPDASLVEVGNGQVDVRDLDADMVHAAARILLEKLGNRTRLAQRLLRRSPRRLVRVFVGGGCVCVRHADAVSIREQLNLGVSEVHECCGDAVRGQLLGLTYGRAERGAVHIHRHDQVGHHNGQVVHPAKPAPSRRAHQLTPIRASQRGATGERLREGLTFSLSWVLGELSGHAGESLKK